jgi:hypothetical protein
MPPKKVQKVEHQTSFYLPARNFAFTLSPPTDHDNGDEIVLHLTEDGVESVWETWLFDEDVGACDPDDMVIMLNRGDYLLDTSDDDYYPRKPTATTLVMFDGEEKVRFYNKNRGDASKDEEEAEEENLKILIR